MFPGACSQAARSGTSFKFTSFGIMPKTKKRINLIFKKKKGEAMIWCPSDAKKNNPARCFCPLKFQPKARGTRQKFPDPPPPTCMVSQNIKKERSALNTSDVSLTISLIYLFNYYYLFFLTKLRVFLPHQIWISFSRFKFFHS